MTAGPTTWDELVSTALLGTERRPFAVDRLAAVVDPGQLAGVGGAGDEAAVLAGAAVLGAYRRAGLVPERRARTLPAPAPDDDRPVCSETAAQLLALLVTGAVHIPGTDEPLALWLDACTRSHQRPPDHLLVPLFQFGTAKADLRPAIATAVGARGTWLAGANPEWHWAAGYEPSLDQWTTGTRGERVALLRWLRRDDRPTTARELLQSTWSTEAAAERAAFLPALAPVDDEDEPFLEQALDDRAASVRAAAAELLDTLPDSRRAHRMAERARALVQREGRFRPRLAVTLPEDLDAATRRDGITDTREQGKGLRAAWLEHIVAATPLTVWEDHLAATPEEAVRLAHDEKEVLEGWRQAALRQRNTPWASALITGPNSPLVTVVPLARAQSLLDAAVRSKSTPEVALLHGLYLVPGPWPPDLSRRVIERLRDLPGGVQALPILAAKLDPSVLSDVEDWIARASTEGTRRQVRDLAHALSLRQTIDREFP